MYNTNHAKWQQRSDNWIEMLDKSRRRKARVKREREQKQLQRQIALIKTQFDISLCTAVTN